MAKRIAISKVSQLHKVYQVTNPCAYVLKYNFRQYTSGASDSSLATRFISATRDCGRRYICSSTVLRVEEKISGEEDDCPDWQNPVHHNNPEMQKVMLNEFGPDETPSMVPLPPFDDGSGEILAPQNVHDLADEIVNMSMLEVKELVDRVAEHFGIEDDDEIDLGGASIGGGEDSVEEVQEEKTAFDVKLIGFDPKTKIKVIKEIRAATSLGLKEAKELVEGAPKTVKKGIKMEEAEELKAKLEAVGASVEIA